MLYKYFKDSEIINLKPELVEVLDRARAIAGIPFVITSGYRTVEDNVRVGGVNHSAHRTGEAADLKCSTSQERIKIVFALLSVGCCRIGLDKEHVHVDISSTLPQGVLFLENA